MNVNFDRAKLTRLISTYGVEFNFKHQVLDTFGEPKGEITTIQVKGIFHQTRGYVTRNVSEGTISRVKPQPQILILYDEQENLPEVNDELLYCNQLYRVVALNNYNNLDFAIDISLEVFDDGT